MTRGVAFPFEPDEMNPSASRTRERNMTKCIRVIIASSFVGAVLASIGGAGVVAEQRSPSEAEVCSCGACTARLKSSGKRHSGQIPVSALPPAALRKRATLREEHFAKSRGLKIAPQEGVEGPTLELQQEIIVRLAQQELVPAQRTAHFQWLNQAPVMVVGWGGYIVNMERSRAGWLVKIRFKPRLESWLTAVTQTSDYHDEIYEYTGNGLRFIRGEPPRENLQNLFFM